MRIAIVNLLLTLFYGITNPFLGQESYNTCAAAKEICPNQIVSLNNIDANSTVCGGCEDDIVSCFTHTNSIWLKFTTNAVGGNVSLSFSNLIFQMNPSQGTQLQVEVLSVGLPCNSASYAQVPGTCVTNATGNFVVNCIGLLPNTVYFFVVNGNKNGQVQAAECAFDLTISGVGFDRPAPSSTITYAPAFICKYDLVTFTANLVNCPNNSYYKWYVNGTLVANTSVPTFQSNTLTNGDNVVVVSDCYTLCTEVVTSSNTPLTILEFPLTAGPDYSIKPGESVILLGATTALTYSWGPSFGLVNPDSLQPIANPTQTTTYTLTATDGVCTLSEDVTVFVNSGLIIPNLFTPNGDGNNDTWEIINISDYPDNDLTIYDRWGQLVYEAIGYNFAKAWDGTRKNKPLPEGVYFYKLNLNSGKASDASTGYITIVR